MVVDVLWLTVGLVGGVVGTAVLLEALGRTRQLEPRQSTKVTTGWTLKELGDPIIVVRDLIDVEVPAGSKVYASGIVDPAILKTCDVRQVDAVRAEFALDRAKGRGLLFSAGANRGTLAILTVDDALVSRLESEWRTIASRAGDYVERLRINEMAGRTGVTVETQGLVQDVLPYKGRFMVRLEDEGSIIGVLVSKDPEQLRDERIQVRGDLRKDETGYVVIEAIDIRRVR